MLYLWGAFVAHGIGRAVLGGSLKTLNMRPAHSICPEPLWKLMCDCWRWDPGRRPSMDEIVYRLQHLDLVDYDSPLVEEYEGGKD